MYVCMYVHVYVCMYACVYLCVYMKDILPCLEGAGLVMSSGFACVCTLGVLLSGSCMYVCIYVRTYVYEGHPVMQSELSAAPCSNEFYPSYVVIFNDCMYVCMNECI
jgi:hypothetical protein